MPESKLISISDQNTTNLDTASYSKSIIFVEPLGKTDIDGSIISQPADNKKLFIYVDLKAERKKRTIISITDDSNKVKSINTGEAKINLIGYREGTDGSKIMTTDWTHKPNLGKGGVIGRQTDFGNNVFEGFGVESIDINIIALGPAKVKIRFIDVRGGGLFDQETFNPQVEQINAFQNSTSPYSIFFERPAPLFYLTVKGFYGNPVTLCLYMLNWKGTFNSETGNFEMDAEFMSRTFSFLNDFKIGHLIAAGNTEEGRKKLEEVSSYPTAECRIFPTLTIDELAIRFQKIIVERENVQKNSKDFDKIKVINEQINFVKQLRTILGYTSTQLPPTSIFGAKLDTSFLVPNQQQIFFRDVGLIAKTTNDQGNGIVETKFEELYKNVDAILKKYEELKNGYPNEFVQDGLITKTELSFPESLSKVNDTRSTIGDALDEVNRLILENEPNGKIPKITVQDFSGTTKGNWVSNSGFYILNLKNTRDVIKNKLNKLIEERKNQEKLIEEKFNKTIEYVLGFKPTISNVIGILCNNIEMFLERMYSIALLAESKNDDRVAQLSGYINDSPDSEQKTKVYPFPKVTDSEFKEIYLGKILGISKDAFPEIDFVDSLCTGLVYSIKQINDLKQSSENTRTFANSDFFPINVFDVYNKAYEKMDELPTETYGANINSINSSLVETILKRAFIAYTVSRYEKESFAKIADFEARNLFTSFQNDSMKDVFNQIPIKSSDVGSLLFMATGKNIISPNLNISANTSNGWRFKNNQILYTSDGSNTSRPFFLEINGTCSSGNRLWNVDLNLSDNLKFNENIDPKKFTSTKQNQTYIKRFYDTNLTYLNKSYFSLATFKNDDIKNSIKDGRSLDLCNLLETSTVEKFLISNYFYIDRTQFNSQVNVTLTNSSIYKSVTTNDNISKAYLILSSFLFNSEKILEEEINNDYTKIIRLPYMYILWLGANSYRSTNSTEILSFDAEFLAVPKTNFYYVTKRDSEPITNPILVGRFQKEFENWANSADFFLLKNYLEILLDTNNLNETDKKKCFDEINRIILKEVDLVISNPIEMIIGPEGSTGSIPNETLSNYLEIFMTSYNAIYKEKRGTNTADKKEETVANQPVVNDNDLKYAYYMDLKQIYDNWIAGNINSRVYSCCKNTEDNVSEDITKNKCNSPKEKLFDLFKFVDKFRNETAGDAIININSFNDLVGKRDVEIYSFISKILTDSYFMFFDLPFYLNFSNADEGAEIFEAQDTLKKIKGNPSLLCVYNGPPSTTLNSSTNYGNDSFKFTDKDLPKGLFGRKEDQKNSYLVAFNVNYGSQSQSIFKNVSVSTEESKVTGEYIVALTNLVLGTGESKPLLKDNSIFPLMRNRSYTATIQMMGDMMIQPQMYFQLNNIPFFSGSYMIMNVSHQIKPNNIVTTFRGVRQNRSPVTVITEPITFLTFQYDKGIYSSTTVTIENPVDPVVQAQSADNKPVVPTNVLLNYAAITGNNILKQYNQTDKHLGLDIEVESSSTYVVSADKNGTILINAVGDINTPGYLVIAHDPEEDGYTYYTAYFGIINNNNLQTGSPIRPKTNIGTPISGIKTIITEQTINPINERKIEEKIYYYYHYEIARTKQPIKTYQEYRYSVNIEKLDPQQYSPNLKVNLTSEAIHNNSIYGDNAPKVTATTQTTTTIEEIYLSEYKNDSSGRFESLKVSIDPSKGKWKIFAVDKTFKITSDCENGDGYTSDNSFISSDGQSVLITFNNLVDIDCLNAPINERTGDYNFVFKIWAVPLLSNGNLDTSRTQYTKNFKVEFKL